jgi:hypothetical protein
MVKNNAGNEYACGGPGSSHKHAYIKTFFIERYAVSGTTLMYDYKRRMQQRIQGS